MVMKTPRGMRDLMPEDKRKKEYIISVIRRVFENYGFRPLETPAVESYKTLSAKFGGGKEIKREIYHFKDKGGRELGLRFELTTPLARVVASNPNLPKPFKRYQIGRAWRYDRPQASRYREFTQADIDILGTDSVQADLECLQVTVDLFKELGLKPLIRINNRKILEGLALDCNIPKSKVQDLFRSIDKLDKIGWKGVKKEMKKRNVESKKFLSVIKKNELPDMSFEVGQKGKEELEELVRLAKKASINRYLKTDLSLVRGLDYYTGLVFEIKGDKWSCGGGGRYDELVENFGGEHTPAVGISYGVDRLMEMVKEVPDRELYYVAVVGDVRDRAIKIAKKLRKEAPTMLNLKKKSLSSQLRYASKMGASKVAIVGEKDLKKKKITIRDMDSGKEKKKKISDL